MAMCLPSVIPMMWAVGTEGTILHQTGSVWVIEGGVLGVAELTGVWVGADAVVVVGRSGRIYSKIQGNWNIEPGPMGAPITDDLFSAWGVGTGDSRVVYAAGAKEHHPAQRQKRLDPGMLPV